MDFLRLIRFKNLAIIIVTQYLMRFFVIQPILLQYNMQIQMGEFNFFLLTFSTCLLAGAGYIINDYFDRKADLINRPDTVIVGVKIRRRLAMIWHSVFNFVGVGIGFYLSIIIDAWYFGFFFLGISGILWYYSTFYKKRVFIGNFVVAILTGLVALLALFAELPGLQQKYAGLLIYPETSYHLLIWVSGFSFFAFITTLIREIVKDMEDVEGDIENNRKSLPIVFGFLKTKIAVWILTGFTILLILFSYFY
ncbi:MAG: geranylgeranylglycerol-phosphate geranylgeranyltransferase, partial [Bacteroidales bacterium]|nr:geranylgeranylglycerol-phosphate geranylgeranyltransferase [Bacteroidales bacterium]